MSLWWFRQLRRPGAQPRGSPPTSGVRCAAALSSASGSRCTRSSASRAATPPARACWTTAPPHPTTACAGIAVPAGLGGRQPTARGRLHPGDQGRARRARRERVVRRAVRRDRRRPAAAELRDRTLAVYGRAEAIARERGDHPRRHQARVRRPSRRHHGARRRGAHARLLRFWPGRPVALGDRRSRHYDKQIVQLGALAGVRLGPARVRRGAAAAPPEVVERTRSRYVEAYELLTGSGSEPGPPGRAPGPVSFRSRPRSPSTTSSPRTGRRGSPAAVGRAGRRRPGARQRWVDVTKPGLRPQMHDALRAARRLDPRALGGDGAVAWRHGRPDLASAATPTGCDVTFRFSVRVLGPVGRAFTALSVPAVRADLRRGGGSVAPLVTGE